MRKFRINVNGKSYEVEVEEIRDGAVVDTRPTPAPATAVPPTTTPTTSAPSTPAPATAASSAQTPPVKSKTGNVEGGTPVTAPMPGTVLSVKVKEGEKVERGQVLLILEAMKMENEIVAPQEGTVLSVNVDDNASVNSGDTLVVIG
ncbi:MAG TPA: biotin/lipoyl-binding protein [Clostridiales bacterium]|nr:biotin/lipoyl-binding protein [Clostridiales bacterium]